MSYGKGSEPTSLTERRVLRALEEEYRRALREEEARIVMHLSALDFDEDMPTRVRRRTGFGAK
jgi:hypothetical protein